jgi:transcriptional antiterminator NusG
LELVEVSKDPTHKLGFAEGEVVGIIDGPFKGFDGTVSEVDSVKGKIKVLVNLFWSRNSC